MKPKHSPQEGSVLITAVMTITILTLICATSLYVASQNHTTGMETASWHQSLTAAESGVDAAIRALNTGTWTNWRSINTTTLPTAEPTGASYTTASAAPDSSHYNYLPSSASLSSLTMSGSGSNLPEGATNTSWWVTVDQGGGNMPSNQDTSGKQWYRIRSTGIAAISGPGRVGNNKLDSDLRNTIALKANRKGGTTLGPTRTIEVIMQPLSSSIWSRGITAVDWISLSGGTIIDSYNSQDPSESNWQGGYGIYDPTKHGNHGDVATTNSTSSDFRSVNVYGNVAYSGPAIKNTSNVHGVISTPGPSTPAPVSAPSWGAGTYTSYSSFNNIPSSTINAQHQGTATYIKITGDLTVPGGTNLHILQHDSSGLEQVYIWVTGKLTTSGSGYINQDPNIQVTWYVGGDITISGSSYQNQAGQAADLTIYGYGSNNKATISGSAAFVGTLDAPKYDTTISGGGDFDGALITDTLTMSGGSSFHYDESLNGGASAATGNYTFASWFEDNSDPTHKQKVTDNVAHATVYAPIIY